MNVPKIMEQEERDASRRAAVVTWAGLASAIVIGVTIVGGALAILQWLYNENNNLRAELSKARIEMVQQQFQIAASKVSKEEFASGLKDLSERFERGFDRLERRIVTLGEKK